MPNRERRGIAGLIVLFTLVAAISISLSGALRAQEEEFAGPYRPRDEKTNQDSRQKGKNMYPTYAHHFPLHMPLYAVGVTSHLRIRRSLIFEPG